MNYWVFISSGSLKEIEEVITSDIWDFIDRKKNPKTPNHYRELIKGDKILFYLSSKLPNKKKNKYGKSLIGRAELASDYIENDGEYEKFVHLINQEIFPTPKFIVPGEYNIGIQIGQMIAEIEEKIYKKLL